MRAFRDIPIRHKLTLIIMLTSIVALMLACVGFMAYEVVAFRDGMVRNLITLAEVIGHSSTAALTFNDPRSAKEALEALVAEPHIVWACMYTKEGWIFAEYIQDPMKGIPPPGPLEDGYRFEDDHLVLFRPIFLEGERMGTVYLRSDLKEMRVRLERYVGIAGLVLMISALAAFGLSSKLRDVIARPILHLAETASRVSAQEDYSLRAVKPGGDELGLLTDRFNEMLSKIQERDRALQESEARYRTLIESQQEGVAVVDPEEHFVFANPAAHEIFGVSEGGLVGQHLETFTDPMNLAVVLEQTELHRSAKKTSYDFEIIRPDGARRILLLTATPQFDEEGRFSGTLGVFRDITEQKRAQEALREAFRREEAMGRIRNRIIAMRHTSELSSELERYWIEELRVLGIPIHSVSLELPAPVPDGFVDFQSAFLEDGTTSTPTPLAEYPWVKEVWDSGKPMVVSHERLVHAGFDVKGVQTVLEVPLPGGGSLGVSSTIGDAFEGEEMIRTVQSFAGLIAEGLQRVQDFETLRRAEEELAQRAEALARSNAELQDFAYVASHDLQEPLRKIQAFGDRLKSKCGDTLSDRGRDYLERMQNAAGRMQILINGLLEFSRVATKAQPFETVDLGRVAREVISDLEVRIQETDAQVEVDGLPTLHADPLQMRQLLQNLIGNALKFHREGEALVVKIYSQLPDPPQGGSEEGKLGDRWCQLMVEDNGIGFDEKYMDRIFGMFQRLHGRGAYEGSGVGLAICRKIVDRHGGSIAARSTPGEGATFIVRLPCGPSNQQASRRKDQAV